MEAERHASESGPSDPCKESTGLEGIHERGKTWPLPIRLAALDMRENQNKSMADVSFSLRVPFGTLYNWVVQFEDEGRSEPAARGGVQLAAECLAG